MERIRKAFKKNGYEARNYWLPLIFAFVHLYVLPIFPAYAESPCNGIIGKMTIYLNTGSDNKNATVVLDARMVFDSESKKRGLSGRATMPDDSGMLFFLDEGHQNFFWMKGMQFPLDILFFDSERRLTDSFLGLLPCEECPVLSTPEGTAYALEIKGGAAKKYGLKSGDRFVLSEKMSASFFQCREKH